MRENSIVLLLKWPSRIYFSKFISYKDIHNWLLNETPKCTTIRFINGYLLYAYANNHVPQGCQVVKKKNSGPQELTSTTVLLPHPLRAHECIHRQGFSLWKIHYSMLKQIILMFHQKKSPFILIFVPCLHSNFLWSHNSWFFFSPL